MKNYLIIFFLLLSNLVFSQEEENILPQVSGNYIGINAGLSSGLVRDLITSPLFYTSALAYIDINYQNIGEKNIFQAKFASHNGINALIINENSFIGFQSVFDFNVLWLRVLESSLNKRVKHFLGAELENYTSIRINLDFMNAASCIDNINNISIAYQANFVFRRAEKEKKLFGLINYKRKEQFYLLTAGVSVPVISLYYRPEFTIPGNATLNDNNIFDGYSLKPKVFSGLASDISISRILHNGNMIKFGYSWMFATNGKTAFNRLEFSHHIFSLGLVFKIN